MQLNGSCHCGKVRFTLECPHPFPFNLCYCSICRKTAGGGGFAINLGGIADSLRVTGTQHVKVYQAQLDAGDDGQPSPAERRFCRVCGSALWVWDPRWPELVHPFASAIDTPLPVAAERVHLMVGSKAPWVEVMTGTEDQTYDAYPSESIAEWHRRRGLER